MTTKSDKENKVQFWRILQIDKELRAGSCPTTGKLAQQFEVCRRTVERDIEFLRDRYHAPIAYSSEKKGFVYTQPTFFLKSLFLTEEEFFSVAVFEKVLHQYRNTPIEGRLRAVFEKLAALLPENKVSLDTMWIDDAVSFIADPAPEIHADIFSAVFTGLKTRHAIRFLYRSLEQPEGIERECEPYHVVCQRGVWYVIGQCRLRQELRIFSLSRIQRITVLSDEPPFSIPENFSAESYIDPHIGIWMNRQAPFTVRLLFDPAVRVFAEEHIWNTQQTVKVYDDESVEVCFETTQFEEIKRFVLGQGRAVRVLEPEDLIDAVREEAAQLCEMYRS